MPEKCGVWQKKKLEILEGLKRKLSSSFLENFTPDEVRPKKLERFAKVFR